MTLNEFLTSCSKEELTNRLILLDKSIMELHQNGFFVVSDIANIVVYDNEITLASFSNKVDYLVSGYNSNGDKKDILEICAAGICAYNNFKTIYTNKEFLAYVMNNFDTFLENGKIPKKVADYYRSVFVDGNINYLSVYLDKLNPSNNRSNSAGKSYTKSTAIGRAFMENDNAAYVNVLLVPALITLAYIVVLCVYMFFLK